MILNRKMVKKMAEQWLIDSGHLFEFLSDQLVKESGAFSKGVNKGLNIARSAIRNVDAIKPIDPETIPIVRQLRANIAILEQIIENGSNPIDKDKIVSLMMENAALKSQIVNITAEKNAAINDLLQVGRGYDFCTVCAHCCEGGKPKYRPQEPYMEFCKKCNDDYSQFEWRDSWDGKNEE